MSTKRFDDYIAVADADFSIGAGEFFSMLGPSGCGKTTTLRMIAGFETPTEGAIRPEGVDVSRTPPHKRNVNTVFQHYAPFPHMTVGQRRPRAAQSEEEQGASQEERRRVARRGAPDRLRPAQAVPAVRRSAAARGPARALVNYPSALLLDEPLGALDLKLRHVMQFRTQTDSARGRNHVRLRDPRPGGSADDE